MREPHPEAILAARIARAWPSLSTYTAARLAHELALIEKAQRRHAERCCCGEDGGYVRRIIDPPNLTGCVKVEHDPEAEERAERRIERRLMRWKDRIREMTCSDDPLARRKWQAYESPRTELHGDPRGPRGPVLLVKFPGEVEAQSA